MVPDENLPRDKRTFLQLAVALFALLILTALVGGVYQFAESEADIAKHPAPGRLADNSPTWSAVQPAIAIYVGT